MVAEDLWPSVSSRAGTFVGTRRWQRSSRGSWSWSTPEIRDALDVHIGGEKDGVDLPAEMPGESLRFVHVICVVDLEVTALQIHRELLQLTLGVVDDEYTAVGFHQCAIG